MGDYVGELAYGIEVDEETCLRLCGQSEYKKRLTSFSWEEVKAGAVDVYETVPEIPGVGPFCHTIPWKQKRNLEFELISPYETDQYFIFITISHRSSFNQAVGIGKSIDTNPEWDSRLKWASNEYGFEYSDPQWFLIGRYN